jgi:hypothetical protein
VPNDSSRSHAGSRLPNAPEDLTNPRFQLFQHILDLLECAVLLAVSAIVGERCDVLIVFVRAVRGLGS